MLISAIPNENGSGAAPDTQPAESNTQITCASILSVGDLCSNAQSTHSARLASLRERFAERRYKLEVVHMVNPAKRIYVVASWSQSHAFETLDAVEKYLAKVGGAA